MWGVIGESLRGGEIWWETLLVDVFSLWELCELKHASFLACNSFLTAVCLNACYGEEFGVLVDVFSL